MKRLIFHIDVNSAYLSWEAARRIGGDKEKRTGVILAKSIPAKKFGIKTSELIAVVEQYSIDECFLDMSGTGQIYPDPIAIAAKIKNEIRDTLNFTVNVGIGSNKLLAKMASDFEKPDKIHTLFSGEVEAKLWPLSVRELFTVGQATARHPG